MPRSENFQVTLNRLPIKSNGLYVSFENFANATDELRRVAALVEAGKLPKGEYEIKNRLTGSYTAFYSKY